MVCRPFLPPRAVQILPTFALPRDAGLRHGPMQPCRPGEASTRVSIGLCVRMGRSPEAVPPVVSQRSNAGGSRGGRVRNAPIRPSRCRYEALRHRHVAGGGDGGRNLWWRGALGRGRNTRWHTGHPTADGTTHKWSPARVRNAETWLGAVQEVKDGGSRETKEFARRGQRCRLCRCKPFPKKGARS